MSTIRERAAELVTLDLGPRTDHEIEARLRHDIGAERLTVIDPRPILSMEGTLRTLGKSGDIIRSMQREPTARNIQRPWLERSLFGAGETEPAPVVGRVIARGLADGYRDRHYLLVDGGDGHAHYIDIGRGDAIAPIPEDAIVRVSSRSREVRDADRVVADVAAANGGRYSIDLHLRHDRSATQAFAETHVRRLEAMRRACGGVAREPDGSWTIAADHVAPAAPAMRRGASRPAC